MELDYRFWIIILVIWLLVPFTIQTIGTHFNEDTSYTPYTWTQLTTDAEAARSFVPANIFEALDSLLTNLLSFNLIPFQDYFIDEINSELPSEVQIGGSGDFNFLELQLIRFLDAYVSFAVEPLYDYYQNFKYSLDVLVTQFGFSSDIVNILLGIFWIIPLLFIVLFILRLIEVAGGFFPG